MDLIKQNDKILLLWDASYDLAASGFNADTIKSNFNATINFENVERLSLASYENSTFTFIIVRTNDGLDIPFFASLLKLLKPSGRLLVPSKNATQTLENLKLAGFINVATKGNDILAEKPNYNVGSAVKLSFAKAQSTNKTAAAVWKLSDDGEEDLINEDDLLDESDKIKPNPTELRVCGTTGKRKACKDCSCGLAEELAGENKPKAATDNAKSSCGSCYLGDAFRCATCPYLGMPAFKPGEKVQLAGGLLKDDI